MPIANGHFESIVPGKNRNPLSKRFAGAALTGLLAHALASVALAQALAPSWTDLGVKWEVDATWGDGFSKSRTRMAADDKGNLFVSNGDSLNVGSPSGAAWKTQNVFNSPASWRHTPVILGAGGTVLWGSWTSADRGATWKKVSENVSGLYYSAAAISPDGYCLFGGSMDHIARSAKLGDKPEQMHFGNSFGSIIDFAITSSGKVYAAPEVDDMLVSLDAGKTWKARQTLLKSGPAAPTYVHLASGLLALEPAYPEESLWMASGRWGDKKQAVEYVWSGDSLVARRHANLKAPDSALTAFCVQKPVYGPTVLWLGTWGQGVYRSVDRGESWQAVNSGLRDLHVEAMVEGSEGRIFALTRLGLFSLSDKSLGIAPFRASRLHGRGTGTPSGNPGGSLLFGAPEGRQFRIDGRVENPIYIH
jgi:hypothetical protein